MVPDLDLRFIDTRGRAALKLKPISMPRYLPELDELYKRRDSIKRHIPAVLGAALSSVAGRREMRFRRAFSSMAGTEFAELPASYLVRPPTKQVAVLLVFYHAINRVEEMVREKQRRMSEATLRIDEVGGVGVIGTRKQIEARRRQLYIEQTLAGLTGTVGGAIGFGIMTLLTDDPKKIAAGTAFGDNLFGLLGTREKRRPKPTPQGVGTSKPRRTSEAKKRRLKTRTRRARTGQQKARGRRQQRQQKAKAKTRRRQASRDRRRERAEVVEQVETATNRPAEWLETVSIGRDHELHVVRGADRRLHLWLCSRKCGQLISKIETYLSRLPENAGGLRGELTQLRAKVREVMQSEGSRKAYNQSTKQLERLRRKYKDDFERMAQEKPPPERKALRARSRQEGEQEEKERKKTRGLSLEKHQPGGKYLPDSVRKALKRIAEIREYISRRSRVKNRKTSEQEKLDKLKKRLRTPSLVHKEPEFEAARDASTQLVPAGSKANPEQLIWLKHAQHLMNELNKKAAKEGDGSVAFAIIGEQVRGGIRLKPIVKKSDTTHYDKGWNYMVALRSLLVDDVPLPRVAKDRLRSELQKIGQARTWADEYEGRIKTGGVSVESLRQSLPDWARSGKNFKDLVRYLNEWLEEQGK